MVYDRISRGNEWELWTKILPVLRNKKSGTDAEVIIDSATVKVHRHGGGKAKDGRERV
jgi:hypothetical protein